MRLRPIPNVNRTYLFGRVGGRIDFRSGVSGSGYPWHCAIFDIETEETFVNSYGNETTGREHHPIVAWGKLAYYARSVVRRGATMYVGGRTETTTYRGRDDDLTRFKTVITALELDPSPNIGVLMQMHANWRRRIAARCTDQEHEAVIRRALQQGLNMTAYVRQQTGCDPMTHLYVRLPTGENAWEDKWTEIDEDNLDGTYTPLKGAAPVPWREGQPFAVWTDSNVPPKAERAWSAQLPPP